MIITRRDLFPFLPKDTDGNPRVWNNIYHCDECNHDWEDTWSCQCDDECSQCGVSISPTESDFIPSDLGLHPLWDALLQSDGKRETATILAALRLYQSLPPGWIACRHTDIATDGGTLVPLTAAEIDELCERIN